MTKHRWVGLSLGIAIFLTAFGAALAVTIIQVSREVPSTLRLGAAVVISGDNLGLWHDEGKTTPVTSLVFDAFQLQPPLDHLSVTNRVYSNIFIENRSDIDLTIIAPCGNVESPPGTVIGQIGADLVDVVTGEYLLSACARAATIAPGGLLAAAVFIDIDPGLAAGEYDFTAVFGAIGAANEAGPARIAFQSNRDGNFEIYVMNADGSDQTRLTNNSDWDRNASWSPDGTRIAFDSESHITGNNDIFVINADGTGQTRLTDNSRKDQQPAWSPDGTRITFTSDRDGDFEIYVMNADGSDQTGLSNFAAHDAEPDWAPDGTRITFISNRDGNFEIYVMNADGTGQTRLTDNSDTDWQPACVGCQRNWTLLRPRKPKRLGVVEAPSEG